VTSVQDPLPPTVRKPLFPKRPSRNPLLWILVTISGILVALLLFAGVHLLSIPFHLQLPGQKTPLFTWQGSPGQKVLLVMGVDAPNQHPGDKNANLFDGTRTDTMMLLRVDAAKKRVALVSIPRDSKVYLANNRGVDKINAAHALGGPDLAVQTVQDAFGIPIDNFMVINFRGVRELVDAIGGVDLYIEKAMHYTDNTAKLYINFRPGQRHLNGNEAEEFLRFRHDELGDIGRIRRQQQFVMAVTKKLKDPAIVFRMPELVKVANKYVETDLSPNDLLTLAFFGKDIQMNAVRTATLPGHPGGTRVSYWLIDQEPAQVLLDRLILDNPRTYGGLDNTAPAKVGIYYDSMISGALPDLLKQLKQKDFTVVCQAQQRHSSTKIIEHTGRTNDDTTDQLRQSAGQLRNARLIFAPVGTTFENNVCSVGEDYTLVLGADSAASP
jgi:LCP family protein required for cell wall assembly